jgi:hypothetical protein
LTPQLLRAFRATRYTAGPATARIGRRCPALDPLLRCQAGAFITAWNPWGRRAPLGWNRRANRALLQRLRGMSCIAGTGEGRGWREEHWLVVTDPRRAAVLARQFRQAAVVTLRRDQPARLTVLARPRPVPASTPG